MVRALVLGVVALVVAGMPSAAAGAAPSGDVSARHPVVWMPSAAAGAQPAVVAVGPHRVPAALEAVALRTPSASGARATTLVPPPEDEGPDWAPLGWGLFVGLLMGVAVGLWGYTEHREARERVTGPAGTGHGPTREERYAAVRAIVDTRMATLPEAPLRWRPLDRPRYDLTSPVGNLEAGWSFRDSWVSNISVVTTALIALLTSADALTAALSEELTAALGVMTVGGLVSVVLIAIANTVAKLVGGSLQDVTVLGLVLSTSIVVLAAGLQIVTVGLAVVDAVDGWAPAAGALLLAAAAAVALEVLAFRTLGQALRNGFADTVPRVPATAVDDWAASEPWQEHIVAGRIRATYADWLVPGPAEPVASALPGGDRWTVVIPPPAPERRRSLL